VSESAPGWDVAGIGSMVVDTICPVPRLGGADQKIALPAAAQPRSYVGGVMLNQLGWTRLFGLRVAVFGKQADDANGRLLREGMRRLGIEPRLDLSGGASSFAQVYVDPTGARSIYMSPAATAELVPAEIDRLHRGVIEASRVVSSEISQVPLGVVRRVFELARAAGGLTVLDLDVPLRDAVPALGSESELFAALGLARILKPSLSATEGLCDARDPAAVASELAKRTGAEVVAVTAGERGCVLWVAGACSEVRAPRVRVADSTGAGDAFLGGLLAGHVLGLGWEEAARLGNACGAACCEQIGAFPDDAERCRARALELFGSLGGDAAGLRRAPVAAKAGTSAGGVERFLEVALEELRGAARRLERAALVRAVELIRAAEAGGGRVHVTGVGKPEHVARYGAALLSSTGTPATFLHATEATHGSVGQLARGDVLIALSNSGETRELLDAVRAARGLEARIVAVTARADSPLARAADVVLEARVEREGGGLGLAPRASVLAETLVLAALSAALEESGDFRREDYHLRHPAGALGRRSKA
jgi:arabinose-5-phosphate isomerase